MESELLLKQMGQLKREPENIQRLEPRPKMANYVLLSFGSDGGGLNQSRDGAGREQILFNG